jgi:hypothetical protein
MVPVIADTLVSVHVWYELFGADKEPVSTTTNKEATSALVIYRPLVEKLVAALGALATHHIAYLLAPMLGFNRSVATGHGHLSLQWAVVTPLAVIATTLFIVWQLRSLGFRSNLSGRALGQWTVGFFIVQESIEGLVAGQNLLELATHPAIVAGVLLGPIVGWALARLLAEVTELAAKLLGGASSGVPPRGRLIPIPVRANSTRPGTRSRPRAPPSSFR